MKRLISITLLLIMCISLMSCASSVPEKEISPQISQMKSICELSTMECYYHNVAKYNEPDASGVLWWKKDRKFWIEYSGIVTIGIDASRVVIEVDDENVTITLPPAEILSSRVDQTTLNEESVYIAADSAKVEAEHQQAAFKDAQERMREQAENDTTLLAAAQQRAQKLLEDYVNNIGTCIGKTYTIKWVYLDNVQKPDNANTETVTTVEE